MRRHEAVIKSAGPDPEAAMLCGEVSSAACKTCGAGPGIEDEVIVRPSEAVPRRAALGWDPLKR